MFPAPHPDIVVYGWAAFAFAFVVWAIWFYGFHKRSAKAITAPSTNNTEVTPAFISKSDSIVTKKQQSKQNKRD